jgi:hypothetical protein
MKLSNKAYDILKYIALIALPAIATAYAALGEVWAFPLVTEISTTIMIADTLLGALLQISSNQYHKQND